MEYELDEGRINRCIMLGVFGIIFHLIFMIIFLAYIVRISVDVAVVRKNVELIQEDTLFISGKLQRSK